MLWPVISTFKSAVTFDTFAMTSVMSKFPFFPAIGYQQLRDDVVQLLVVDARLLGEEV